MWGWLLGSLSLASLRHKRQLFVCPTRPPPEMSFVRSLFIYLFPCHPFPFLDEQKIEKKVHALSLLRCIPPSPPPPFRSAAAPGNVRHRAFVPHALHARFLRELVGVGFQNITEPYSTDPHTWRPFFFSLYAQFTNKNPININERIFLSQGNNRNM